MWFLHVNWRPMNLVWQVDWLFHPLPKMLVTDLHVHGTYNNWWLFCVMHVSSLSVNIIESSYWGFFFVFGFSSTMNDTFCFSSSVRASIRTLAHGSSFGHHGGRVDSLPHPGFPRPVEYFSINGINARNCACVIFSTGVGMPSIISGGNSNNDGSSWTGGGACCANAASNSSITILLRLRTTSSSGFAPNTL